MKKIMIGLIMLLMVFLLTTPMASAYTVSAGDLITITQGIGGGDNGGAFNIYLGNTFKFDTFCVERNEYFSPGGSYYIGSITNNAINGGISGGNPDPLSSESAYLFSRWSSWTIAHTAANANALQLAIWKVEGEWGDALSGSALVYYNEAYTNKNDTLYGVQVMNIFGDLNSTVYQQDMLVGVPEPTTMLLLGFGLLGVAGIRRFKK